jgi:hypothetical protein
MGPTLRRVSVSLLIVAVATVSSASTAAVARAQTDARRADRAVGFIAAQQRANGSIPAFSRIGSTADAILAFVAAGTGHATMLRALGYLHAKVLAGKVNTIGLLSKVSMAVAATNRNPRRYARHDLLREIRSTRAVDGRFGSASVLDESLAILAIEGAGASAPPSALGWLASAECPDGGWQFDEPYNPATDDIHCLSTVSPGTDFFESDTNTTGYAVQALEAAGRTSFPYHPLAFFHSLRDRIHGGWGYTAGFTTTDANSTSLVIQAYLAAGKRAPSGSLAALRALQYSACGAFAYSWNGSARSGPDLGATIGALPGLLLRPFPYTGMETGDALVTPACP